MDRDCANPICTQKINGLVVSSKILYCGHCQAILRDLKSLFPGASLEALHSLLFRKKFNLKEAARILGENPATFWEYCIAGKIRSEKNGRLRFISASDLKEFANKKNGKLTFAEAAERLKISKRRLRYLAEIGLISYEFDFLRQTVVKESQLSEISAIHIGLKKTESSRKGQRSKPKTSELSVSQIRDVLKVSDAAIRIWIYQGKLKSYKRDGRHFVKGKNFLSFCRDLVTGKLKTYNRIKSQAQNIIAAVR